MWNVMRMSAALLLVVAACADAPPVGQGGGAGLGGEGSTPPSSSGTTVGEPAAVAVDAPDTEPAGSRYVDFRLRGVNAEWPVELALRSLVVKANGATLPVSMASGTVRLDARDHAWRMAGFEVPEEADTVTFEARFAATGALYEGLTSRPLDFGGAPLVFTTRAVDLLSRHKVVVDLDMRRSLEEEEVGATVLPHFNVRY